MTTALSQGSIALISRPKLNGLGKHYGVLMPNNTVYHLDKPGQNADSLELFSQGKACAVERIADLSEHASILNRLHEAIKNPGIYNEITNNCEHFANWIISGKKFSPQLQKFTFVAIALGGIFFLARSAR